MILVIALVTIPKPAVISRAGPRAGASSSFMNRPSRKLESRSGASRKSSALREGGVSTTIRSQRAGAARVLVELAELLHRHVLLRARERARDGDVERVGQDLLGLLRAGLASHHLVEGALHVQHHRVERAALRACRRHAGHRPRGVVEGLDAHRLGQPARRVDGQHHDLAAALGGAQGQRRGGGGLADAAGAAAHDDAAAAVVEQGVDVEDQPGLVGGDQRADAGTRPGALVGGGPSCAGPPRCSRLGELVEPGQVDAAGQPRQLVRRHAERLDQGALAVLEAPPLGVVATLLEQAVDQRRRRRDAGLLQAGRISCRGRRCRRSAGRAPRRRGPADGPC